MQGNTKTRINLEINIGSNTNTEITINTDTNTDTNTNTPTNTSINISMNLDIDALVPTQIRMTLIPRLVLVVGKITTKIKSVLVPQFSCIDIRH